MRKIAIGNYVLEIDKTLVEKFERITCSSINNFAETYLASNYGTRDFDLLFSEHSTEELKETLIGMMQMDIDAYSGLL